MKSLIAVGVGGFVGACLRYGFGRLLARFPALPFGILVSNVAAGLVVGLAVGFQRRYFPLPEHVELLVVVGFAGGLSSMSSMGMDTVKMLEGGDFLKAGLNVTLNVAAGILCAFAGLWIFKR